MIAPMIAPTTLAWPPSSSITSIVTDRSNTKLSGLM